MSAPFLDDRPALDPDPLRAAIRHAYRADETDCVRLLLEEAALPEDRSRRVQAKRCNHMTTRDRFTR